MQANESKRDAEHGPSGQALRSERTRSALLSAAAHVFARDGFEASRIEDIAATAGRSRGAFYANFANKAEVFLALRTLAAERRAREIRELLEPIRSAAPGRLADMNEEDDPAYRALIEYLLEQICDTETQLLQMEFKLFALRHPERLADLAEKHLEASLSVNRRELGDLFEQHGQRDMRSKTLAIEAILEGFALNALFSPQTLTEQKIAELVPKLLRQVVKRP